MLTLKSNTKLKNNTSLLNSAQSKKIILRSAIRNVVVLRNLI